MDKIFVSPLEKSYVFEVLDKYGIEYEKKETYLYYCLSCNKIYIEKTKTCECGSEDFDSVQVGDIIGPYLNYIIESKNKNDLLASLRDGRLYEQLEHMGEFFKNSAYLVFEGNFEDVIEEERQRILKYGKGKRNWGRFNQLLSVPAVCSQYGVHFIQVKHYSTLVKMLKFFNEKCGTAPKYREKKRNIYHTLPNGKKVNIKKLNMPNIVEVISSSVDGFSTKLALRIWEKYKTVHDLCIALKEGSFEQKEIDGVGKVRVEKLKEKFLK